MTYKEFRKRNPQLKVPKDKEQVAIDLAKNIDLDTLNRKIHASDFLMSRRWLLWVLENNEKILNGSYCDYILSSYKPKAYHKLSEHEIKYGEALKNHREIAGYSISKLSKKIAISQDFIDSTEHGENMKCIHYCVLLADLYGISLDELVGRNFPNENKT